jgi:glutaredoxin
VDKIIIYSTKCPKCKQLEKRLNERGIKYEECTDINTMKSLGITTAPYLQVNGELMDFTKAWRWASTQEVTK